MIARINPNSPFSYSGISELLPIVSKITQMAVSESEDILQEMEELSEENPLKKELSDELNDIMGRWIEKVRRLGGEVKGLWLVDFDRGDGNHWCWQYPEQKIEYTHSHEESFSSRRLIPTEVLAPSDGSLTI